MIDIEDLIGINELSMGINLKPRTIYKKIRENKFPKGVKINGRRKFKPKQIVDYYKEMGIEVWYSENEFHVTQKI